MRRNKKLRVVSVFVILVCSAAGVLCPILMQKNKAFMEGSFLFMVFKALAGGIVLSTGFIHMLPDASDALESAFGGDTYPYSALIAVYSAFGCLCIE
jgi:zinc transporter 1/2/3